MAERLPTCLEAEQNLVRILSELLARGIIKAPYEDRVRRAFKGCQSCRGKRKACRGWCLSLKGASAVEFRDFEIRGQRVFARLDGVFSTERSTPQDMDDWQLQPCGTSSCAIEVRELSEGKLVARHHHDLANRGQNGPVWHVQMGGAPARDHRLDVPRWPIAPMDPVLVIELAVYCFFHDTWKSLRTSNPWRRIVKRSEDLLLPHYQMRLAEYRAQEDCADSWLAYQCNIDGAWEPRPA